MIKYFLIWETFLYMGFMTGDLWALPWSSATNQMKYIAVISCLLYMWVRKKKDDFQWVLQCSLFYAAAADYFLLFTDIFVLGIVYFGTVQFCYWMSLKKKWDIRWCFFIGFLVCIMILLLGGNNGYWIMKNQHWLLFILAVPYIAFFLWNLVQVRMFVSKEKSVLWLFIGMLFLLLGDILVGVHYMLRIWLYGMTGETWIMSIVQTVIRFIGPGMWFFYLPSQVCIVVASELEKGEVKSLT